MAGVDRHSLEGIYKIPAPASVPSSQHNDFVIDDTHKVFATAHYHETVHPVIQSFEPHENWLYCYVDEKVVGEMGKSWEIDLRQGR